MVTPAIRLPPAPGSNPHQALCLTHQQVSLGPCMRCGTFVCAGCDVVRGLCPACQARTREIPPFLPVSLLKLAILSICSFGLYELYWSYQNWKREKARTGENLSPVWRTIFGGLCSFSLFRRIHQRVVNEELHPGFSPNGLAFVFLVLTASARLPGALWLISTFSFVPLLPVQAAINRLNERLAPGADRNHRFTAANVVVMVLGGCLLIATVVGSFISERA